MHTEERFKIIIDNRERNADIISYFENIGMILEYSNMPVGDYALSDRVCVERKTASDLESSIIDARFFDQLERLKASFERPMLLVEGNDFSRISANAIMGALVSAYLDYGVQVIWSDSALESADFMASITRREQEQRDQKPRIAGIKKSVSDEQIKVAMVASIPGVGPRLADNLVTHFGSVRNFVNSTEKELLEVEGIGKKKAHNIFSTINAPYKQ